MFLEVDSQTLPHGLREGLRHFSVDVAPNHEAAEINLGKRRLQFAHGGIYESSFRQMVVDSTTHLALVVVAVSVFVSSLCPRIVQFFDVRTRARLIKVTFNEGNGIPSEKYCRLLARRGCAPASRKEIGIKVQLIKSVTHDTGLELARFGGFAASCTVLTEPVRASLVDEPLLAALVVFNSVDRAGFWRATKFLQSFRIDDVCFQDDRVIFLRLIQSYLES